MGRGVLRPKLPKAGTLAQRPNNRWCEYCKNWIHKDRFAHHSKAKHGIVVEIAPTPIQPTIKATVSKANVMSGKKRIYTQKEIEDQFAEPLYEGQPRFEGGIRWEQGGSPGLGKRR